MGAIKVEDTKTIRFSNMTKFMFKVRGQACGDDCTEEKVWVGKLDGNTEGCVYYDTAYTPKSTTWW